MNIEKCYLLGVAMSDAIEPEVVELSIIDRPPGAIDVFIGNGIVSQVMEETPPPATISELRERIEMHRLACEHTSAAQKSIIHMLDNGLLKLTSDRHLTFCAPHSTNYRKHLDLPD